MKYELFTIASAIVIYGSKLPLGACLFWACSISQLLNESGVNSPSAVSFTVPFTVLSQTPVDNTASKYFHNHCMRNVDILWIPDCF